MQIRHIIICLSLWGLENSLLAKSPTPAIPTGERISLNAGWRFLKEDPAAVNGQLDYEKIKPWILPSRNAFVKDPALQAKRPGGEPGGEVSCAQPGFDDSGWRQLNLPHDWGIEGPFLADEKNGSTGKLPCWGVGWYRKHFEVAAHPAEERYKLQMEGAMSHSAIWLNGRFVGGWPYGYASFELDLTPYLKQGDNTLAIRVENPKGSSRWYPGGGIYRNVWLRKTGVVHVAQWGVFVTTPKVSREKAKIAVETLVENNSEEQAAVTVSTTILDQETPVAATEPQQVILAPGKDGKALGSVTLKTPRLWDVKNPQLYTAVTTIERDGKLLDRVTTSFGVRTTKFVADKGFLLNGERVRIQGVCNHHDLGALGAAFNVRAAERQLEIMKEMGVNALRTSHNPPAPELLDLCDRMGILVMDELVDCWKTGKTSNDYGKLWNDWHEADLRAFVRRDRNHPSVIMWSLGNEMPDQGKAEGPAIAASLSKIVVEEDPTRPKSAGCDNVAAAYNGLADNLDVHGFNYKPLDYERFHKDRPAQPVYGSETASTISSRGEYFFPVAKRSETGYSNFQVSSYDLATCNWSNLPDADFAAEDHFPFVAGQFVWTGFDYLGEPSPYANNAPSRSSYFGIVDMAGFKKDRFYLYQARWRPSLPMAHILPHWNWPERVGQVTPVFVYTSGDEAELFLNNKSLGKRSKAKAAFWPENLAAGKTASASNAEAAKLVVDGRSDTIWKAPKGSEAWWQVDLGTTQPLKALRIDFGKSARDYSYRIVCSADGKEWKPLITHTEARHDETHIDYPVDVATRHLKVEFLNTNRSEPALKEFGAYAKPLPVDEDCYRLCWNDVVYEPGELKAVAYKQGKPWAEASVKTTGSPAKLEAVPDRPIIRADGKDLSFVTVNVVDAAGLTVPGAKNLLEFEITGPGEIAGLDNGDATSHESFQGSEHHAWNGKCLVIVRSRPGTAGVITLSASSEGLAPASVSMEAKARP